MYFVDHILTSKQHFVWFCSSQNYLENQILSSVKESNNNERERGLLFSVRRWAFEGCILTAKARKLGLINAEKPSYLSSFSLPCPGRSHYCSGTWSFRWCFCTSHGCTSRGRLCTRWYLKAEWGPTIELVDGNESFYCLNLKNLSPWAIIVQPWTGTAPGVCSDHRDGTRNVSILDKVLHP